MAPLLHYDYASSAVKPRQLFTGEPDPGHVTTLTPGKIAGAVIGGMFGSGILLLVLGFLFFRWRRKRRERRARQLSPDSPEYFAYRRNSYPGPDYEHAAPNVPSQPRPSSKNKDEDKDKGEMANPQSDSLQKSDSKDDEKSDSKSQSKSDGKTAHSSKPTRQSSNENTMRKQGTDLVTLPESLFAHQHTLTPHFPHGVIGFASARSSSNLPDSERPMPPRPSQEPARSSHSQEQRKSQDPSRSLRAHGEEPPHVAANLSYYDTTISMDTDSYEAPPEPPSRQYSEMYEAQLEESRKRRGSTSTLRRIIKAIKLRRSTHSSNHRTRGQDSDFSVRSPGTASGPPEQTWEMARAANMAAYQSGPYLYEEPEEMAGPSSFAQQQQPPPLASYADHRGSSDIGAGKGKGVDMRPALPRSSRSFPRGDSQVRATTEMDPELPSAVYGPKIGSTDNFYGHGLPPSGPPVSAQPPSRDPERLKSPDIPEPMDIDQTMANSPDESFYRSSQSPQLIPGSFVDPMSIFHPTTASEKAHYTTRRIEIENSASPSEGPMSPPEITVDQPPHSAAGAAASGAATQAQASEMDEDYDEFLDLPDEVGRQSIESYDVSTTPATAGYSSTDPSSGRTPETRTTTSPSPFPIKTEPESSASPGPSQTSPAISQSPSSATHTCEECGRSFDQIHKLNHHKRYHDRKHECPYPECDKKFGTKTHLDRHINDKHVKSKAFHCTVPGCAYFKGGKAFPRKDNWRRHMMKKHQHTAATIDAMEESAG